MAVVAVVLIIVLSACSGSDDDKSSVVRRRGQEQRLRLPNQVAEKEEPQVEQQQATEEQTIVPDVEPEITAVEPTQTTHPTGDTVKRTVRPKNNGQKPRLGGTAPRWPRPPRTRST